MNFGTDRYFCTSERVGSENPDIAGKKKLKESASHHLKEIYSANCNFCDFGVISRFVFDFGVHGEKNF